VSHRREHAAALGWYALVAACVFWKVVLAQQVLYWGDILLYFLPMTAFAQRWLSDGVLPIWNPLTLFGQPYLGNPQQWLFYPSTVLLPLLHPARYLSWSMVLHLWLAGFGMWLYLRSLQVGAAPALFGGTAWMLSGAFVPRAQFPGMFQTIALLGWLLWATERVTQTRRAGAGALLALTLAMVWLAGHAQMAYMTTLLSVVWFLWRYMQHGGDRRILLTAATGYAGAVLITAVHWLPMLQLLNETPRAQLSVWAVNRFPLHPEQLLLLLVPDLYGTPWLGNWMGRGNYWEVACAVGMVPLLAAIAAWRVSRQARFWLVTAALCLWLALGPKGGLYFVAYYALPGIKVFHDPARWLIITDFGLCVAAAMGWQALRYSHRWLSLPAGVLLLWALWLWQGENITQWTANLDPIRIRRPETLTSQLVLSAHDTAMLGLGRTVLMALLVVVALRTLPARRSWVAMALLLVEMMPFATRANPACDLRAFTQMPLSARVVADSGGRLFVPNQQPMWRRYVNYVDYGPNSPDHLRRWQEMLGSNIGMLWDIREASGYEPVTVKRGVRHLADLSQAWHESPFNPALLERLHRAGVSAIAFGESVDDWRVVALPHQSARAWLLPAGEALSVRDISPQEVQVHSARPGEVVLLDTAYPGWRVTVNGIRAVSAVHDVTFRKVAVATAPALVIWRYEPDTFRVGLYLTLVGWLVLTAVVVLSASAGKQRSDPK